MMDRRCALMDLAPVEGAPGWWRCTTCSVSINENTHEAYDRDWRPVAAPGRAA